VSNCDLKRQLFADYLACLERWKMAQLEHQEILTAGTGGNLVSRSTLRVEATKALSSAARARYSEHCQAHRC
jgi:hypothetical protein